MLLNRGIDVERLELVRRPKPCKAILQVGDFVRLNSGGRAARVLAIVGESITVESLDWRRRSEAVTLPRVCWQKASVWNWLAWKWRTVAAWRK